MNILLWVIVAVSIALVCFAVAKQTGFKVPSLPANKWVRRGITIAVILGAVAILFPNAVSKIAEDTIGWAKDFDNNYGKAPVVSAPVIHEPQARVVVPSNAFEIDLDEKWSEIIEIQPGKSYDFWCSAHGAEVIMFYSGGTSSHPSGVPFRCSTKDDASVASGYNLRNLRLSFRSFVPGVTATVTH